jgi:hypothetical protein
MVKSTENILTSAQLRQLTAIQSTASALSVTTLRLNSGLKVQSVLDNPQNFFAARALNYRAADLNRILDSIGQNIQVIKTAEAGLEAAVKLLDQAEAYLTDIEQRFMAGEIDVTETVDTSLPDNATAVTFTSAGDLTPYDAGQDGTGVISVLNGGTGITLDGNFWKRKALNYTVTANTILQFDFRSGNQPEIAGIGFDNDTNYGNSNTQFFLYGSQTSGVNWRVPTSTYDYDGSGDWVHVEIPIGTLFTGTFSHMTFINDDDGAGDDGDASYDNIILSEGPLEPNETIKSAPEEIEDEYARILKQLDLVALDSHYRGTNLLDDDDLTTYFNERRSSSILTEGIKASSAGLGLEYEDFGTLEAIQEKLVQVREAREKLRAYATSLAVDMGVMLMRESFTNTMTNILQEGRDNLIIADQNEEGAKLLALQTRQQIQMTVLSVRPRGILDLFS